MSGLWGLVVSEATTNYFLNPSVGASATGYTDHATGTAAGTRYVLNTWQKRGVYSYEIKKTSGGATDQYGFYQSAVPSGAFVAGTYATASLDLYIVSGTVEIKLEKIIGASTTSDTAQYTTSGRKSLSTAALGGTAHTIKVYVYAVSATAEFYVDGMMLERKAYATTYCDGDQPGCSWAGGAHNSLSSRSAQSRAGGRVYNLDAYSTYATGPQGLGMPKIKLLTQAQALLPGITVVGQKIEERAFNLVATLTGTSLANLHAVRQYLINSLKDDLVGTSQPVIIEYYGAGDTVRIPAYYAGGLEYNVPEGFSESVPIQFLAPYPFWTEDGNAANLVFTNGVIGDHYCLIRRQNGVWNRTAVDFGAAVYAAVPANNIYGDIYMGGAFANVGDADGDRIVSYNPYTDSATSLGTGITGGAAPAVNAIAVTAAGIVYAAGLFTTAGGTACANIAKWDGAAWSNIGDTNGEVKALVIDQNGILYAAGLFTTIGGTTYNRIAQYNGSAWSAVGGGFDATVYDLAVGPDNRLYAGGAFTVTGATAMVHAAVWNGSAWTNLNVGEVGDYVRKFAFGPDGTLYAVGDFTTAGGVAALGVAQYNGTQWSPMGAGIAGGTSMGMQIAVDSDGTVYVVGDGTAIGDLTFAASYSLAKWNGSAWQYADIVYTYAPQMLTVINGVLWTSYPAPSTDPVNIAIANTITNNGTRTTYPKLVIKRSGGTRLQPMYIENVETGVIINFNYSLLDGETLTLDLTPGARSCISSIYGNVWRAVARTSNVTGFYLLPGVNTIRVLMDQAGDPIITCHMQWPITHWSADGGAV